MKRELTLSLTMESDDKLEGLTEPEESSSEAETMEGSDDETDEVAPAAAAAQHNYDLRYKRVVPDAVSKPTPAKNTEIAPGVGVVADRYHVGGRVERIPRGSPGVNAGSGNSGSERKLVVQKRAEGKSDELGCSSRDPGDYESYDELPRLRSWRPEATRELSHRASPLYESMSRGELEAQSARLISQLRRSMQERARMLPPPPNELVIRRDSARPSDAGRREQSRREPSASDLLGQVPVKPGRGLFSDNDLELLKYI